MSLQLGSTTNIFGGVVKATEDRIVAPFMRANGPGQLSDLAPFKPGLLWTTSQGLGGQLGNSMGPDCANLAWEPLLLGAVDGGGGDQMMTLSGYTLDASGNPLPSCIVQCFRTVDDVLTGQVNSDNAGYYEAKVPSNVAHYIVAYKSGTPDVAGTTVNTLTPV